MKILITGTHFTPAQAVIEELKKDNSLDIVYVGRNKTLEGDKTLSVESKVLPTLGIEFIPLITGRLQRQISFFFFVSLVKIPIGFLQAFYIVFKQNPDVVVSFGGYVGLPVVLASWLLSKPILIHEQTPQLGIANTISSFFATKIALTYPKTPLGSKEVVVGNPLRKDITQAPNPASKEISEFIKLAKINKMPILLVSGGNQGSHFINILIEEILRELTEKMCVIHQTGDSKYQDFERLKRLQVSLPKSDKYLLQKWIDSNDWVFLLESVDMVLARAGANTLYEMAYFKKPGIVVPLPGLFFESEQSKNAKFFKKLGLVNILEQKNLKPHMLLKKINEFSDNIKSITKMAEKAREAVYIDAAKSLTLEILLLGKNNG